MHSTVKLKFCVLLPDTESATRTAKLCVPTAVGVPEIVPSVDKVRPLGSAPEAMLHV